MVFNTRSGVIDTTLCSDSNEGSLTVEISAAKPLMIGS
jgi:hypothetical protein